MKRKLIAAFSFIILCALFFISLSPLMTDNFVFSREIHPGYACFYTGQPVVAKPLSFIGAFVQAKEMYFTWCGRFMGNLAVYFLFMLPHWLYCILAALAFGAYILIIQICIFGIRWRHEISAGWTLGIFALIWLGIPSFGDAFLWLSVGGQIALLGQALIFLPFRFAFDRPENPHWNLTSSIGGLMLFFAGIAVASLDYATSAALPVTALACIIWFFCRCRKVLVYPFSAALGLILGAALTLGAPGNAARMALTAHKAVHDYLEAGWLQRLMDWLFNIPTAIIMLYIPLLIIFWACLCLWQRYGRIWPRHLPPVSFLFLLPACLTIGAYLFTPWPPARGFSTVFIQLLICGCILLNMALPLASAGLIRIFRFGKTFIAFICILSVIMEAFHFYEMNKIIAARKSVLHAATGDTVALPAMPKNSGDRYWALGSSQTDIADDPEYYVNRAMALHYGLEAVVSDKPLLGDYKPEEQNGVLQTVHLENGRFFSRERKATLNLYYYGNGSLLARFPRMLGETIYKWLAAGKQNDLKDFLVPLFLTRLEIPAVTGESQRIEIYQPDKVWLVKPGGKSDYFDLVPCQLKQSAT